MPNDFVKWQCRVSPTLGELEDSQNKIWGTIDYVDQERPTVFMGLYGLPDFYTLWRHKGRKAIFWCGSDIKHFKQGYWLDQQGDIRLENHSLSRWINLYCENYVENAIEQAALLANGIQSIVCPSFLGEVNNFNLSYKWNKRPAVYTSVSGNDFDLYGWGKIPKIAYENSNIDFHLYGNTEQPYSKEYDKFYEVRGYPYQLKNIFLHGRVPKEQMNEEIKKMQGALRLTTFDGFSEILAKSILMGQWPVSLIPYAHMLTPKEIPTLLEKRKPNIVGREYYLRKLNKFPWVDAP